MNDFIIGNDTNSNAIENETLEPQATALVKSFEKPVVGENSASCDQFIERNFAEKIRREVNNAVTAIKNQILDAILTAIDKIVKPRVELAVRFITESSGRGPSSIVQKFDQSDFSETRKTIRSCRPVAE